MHKKWWFSIHTVAPRPSYDTPMTRLEPTVAASLKQAIAALPPPQIENGDSAVIAEGECCKNNGCKKTYSAERVDNECLYHPGIPVFHEGMKYWSCCQRKTTEFQEFMDQVGCTVGKCKWIEDKKGKEVECRYDWHQTATHVTTAVYAKKYLSLFFLVFMYKFFYQGMIHRDRLSNWAQFDCIFTWSSLPRTTTPSRWTWNWRGW